MKQKTWFLPFLTVLIGLLLAAPIAKAGDGPDAIFNAMIEAAKENRADIVWDALPSSYQTEIQGLFTAFANKMDADIWNKTMGIVGKLSKTLKEKQEFILGNGMVSMMTMNSPVPMDELKKSWASMADTLGAISTSDLGSLETMKSLDIGKLLREDMSKMTQLADDWVSGMSHGEDKKSVRETMIATKVTVLSQDATTARVRVEAPGEDAEEFDMIKVDNLWMPKEFHDEFTDGITEAKQSIDTMEIPADQKPMMIGMMGMAENVLDQMLAANSQAEFDQAINGVMQMLGPMMGGGGGMGGGMGGGR